MGNRAQRHPDLVGRIRSGGHEIALHGWESGLEPMSLRHLVRDEVLEQTLCFRP